MKLIFNPFNRIAGFPALSLGTLILIAGGMLAGFCNARFDGVLDLHFSQKTDLGQPFLDQLLVWVSLVAVFYPLAIILGARPRLIDVAGTLAMARAPYILGPLINASGLVSDFTMSVKNFDPEHFKLPYSGIEVILFVFLILLSLGLLVWMVALYFNAYKTCTNLKGNRLVVSFICGLIAAEILSLYLIRDLFA